MKPHLVIAFLDHPVLGAVQNNSTIGSSPDPLFAHEGLAGETSRASQVIKIGLVHTHNYSWLGLLSFDRRGPEKAHL